MVETENVLLSPASPVGNLLYGYNFYESNVGFGSIQEIVPRGSGCIGAEVILEDQGEQKIVQPTVPLFASRPSRAQEVIARAVKEALTEGSISLR